MDDPAFNARLLRLFNDAPGLPDAAQFAEDVERRLARGWALRRVLILAFGGVGGAIAVGQTLASGLLVRVEGAQKLFAAAREGVDQLPIASKIAAVDLPLGGEAVWLVVGLGVLAIALLASRRINLS